MGETYSKEWCPNCKKHCYVPLGDLNDCTLPDIDGAECPHCEYQWIFNEVIELVGDLPIEDAVIVKGLSTLE